MSQLAVDGQGLEPVEDDIDAGWADRRPRHGSPSGSTGDVVGAQFAYDGHADLTGVFEAVLDLARDLVREDGGSVIVDHVGFTSRERLAGLHGEASLDAGLRGRDALESSSRLA